MQRRMSEIIIARFEDSHSFANAKANVRLVEELQFWTKEYSARIQKAVEDNSQVRGSWDVPEMVEALVKKWAAKGYQ